MQVERVRSASAPPRENASASSVSHALARWLATLALLLAAGTVAAEGPEVVVAGTFPGKAVLIIDGGAPRAVAVGSTTAGGVRVLAVEGDRVTFEVEGRRQTLRAGESVARLDSTGDTKELVLSADAGGHFQVAGQVNGARVSFLVDTGATLVSLGVSDARRAGIDYKSGRRARAQTANGVTGIWLVRLDTLRLGSMVLHNVDAAVHDHELPAALLGMSALGRMDLRNDGQRLVMRRRY